MTKNNYVLAEDPSTDLAIVEATVAELEEYIVKDELYRTLRVHTPAGFEQVQMSGGDLLTRLFRLAAEHDRLTPAQWQQFEQVKSAATQIIYSLRTRFHQRLNREVKARLDSLNWFLDDCISDPRRLHTEYPFEIRNRQRIEVILQELGADLTPELKPALARADERIRLSVRTAGFVWDERLEPVFPREKFWYLYVSP